jgi:DNA-directed RNA polymerase specialized sigma24 family protein
LQRYWYFRSIKAIAADADMSENAVKVMLHRVRERFLHFLEKEGIAL